MLKAIAGFLVALALAPAFAQHNHHHMMMKHGAAKLETHDDAAAQLLTVRLGPLNLPAHSEHMAVTQPGTLFFATPVDGWLLAYHPRLTDEAGSTLPGALLHHVAFWNTRRSDFLCPNNQEHIFGALDPQKPHSEDEVYYVASGRAKMMVDTDGDAKSFDVCPGTIIFVPARAHHSFYDITERLAVLVFFAPAEGSAQRLPRTKL